MYNVETTSKVIKTHRYTDNIALIITEHPVGLGTNAYPHMKKFIS